MLCVSLQDFQKLVLQVFAEKQGNSFTIPANYTKKQLKNVEVLQFLRRTNRDTKFEMFV
jgi:hypothetical protein